MQRALGNTFTSLFQSNGWKKLSKPTVSCGATAVPQNLTAIARISLRLSYNNYIEKDNVKWHWFKLQVNTGNTIPYAFKRWRDKHERGMHHQQNVK